MAGVNVILYQSPGERNVLNRQLTQIASLDCEIIEPFDIESPELLINANDSYLNIDYVYISKFGRYYFRNDLRIENGNQFRFLLESDPLMSFKSQILNSQVVAKRSTSRPNPEIVDNMVSFKDIPTYEYRECPTGFTPDGSGECYVLTLGGK